MGSDASISNGGVHGEEFIQGSWNYFKSTLVTLRMVYKWNTYLENACVWGQITEDAVIFVFQLFCICQQDWLHAYCPFFDVCVADTCRHTTTWAQRNWASLVVSMSLLSVCQVGMAASNVALKFLILSNFLMLRKSTNCLSAAYWFVLLWCMVFFFLTV